MAEMLERIRATARDNQGRWPSRTDLMDETLIRSKDVLYGADGLVSCFSQPTLVMVYTHHYEGGIAVVGWSTGEVTEIAVKEVSASLNTDAVARRACGAPPLDNEIEQYLKRMMTD